MQQISAYDLQILYPILAMMLLPFLVVARVASSRVIESRKNRIHPQAVATRADSSAKFKDNRANDNLMNLFETPVLFYVLGGLILIVQPVNAAFVPLMWGFVFFRAMHTWIHCTSNIVKYRFAMFTFAGLCLLALYVAFALSVLTNTPVAPGL